MKYELKERNSVKYIEFYPQLQSIKSEEDAMDMIALCFEEQASGIILPADAFADDFYKLRTGLAGIVLQKLINYQIKAAIIFTEEERVKGKFKEFLEEANRGKDFRSFASREEAGNWLVSAIIEG